MARGGKMSQDDPADLTRRTLFKTAATVGTALGFGGACAHQVVPHPTSATANASVIGMKFAPTHQVRVGFIGTGKRGMSHVRDLLTLEGVQVTAICDIKEENARM